MEKKKDLKIILSGDEAKRYLKETTLRLKRTKFPRYGLTITLWMIHKDQDESGVEKNLITEEIKTIFQKSFSQAMVCGKGELVNMRCFNNYVELDLLILRTTSPASCVIGLKTASSRKMKAVKSIDTLLHEGKFWSKNYNLSQMFSSCIDTSSNREEGQGTN